MSEPIHESVDPVGGGDGEGRTSTRALMVRDLDANLLSPYMAPTMGGPYLEGAPSGVNFSQLLHAMRRRWLLALIVGLLVGLPAAALVWMVTPENYEVVAWLHVGDPPSYGRGGGRNPAEYEQYLKTQSARIKSPQVLNAVLNKPGILELPMLRNESEPLRFLEDELIVATPPQSEVLLIKMRGKDARQLVKLVNAVTVSYLENVVNAEQQQNLKKRELLDKRYRESKAELMDKRKRVQELAEKYNAPTLEEVRVRSGLLMQRSQSLWSDIMEVRQRLRTVRAQLALLQERGDGGYSPPEQELDLEMARDDIIMEYTRQLSRMQEALDYQKTLSRRGGRDSTVQQYAQAIERAQQRLEERRAEIRPQIMQRLQREMDRMQGVGNLAQMEATEKFLASDLEKLQKEYDEVKEEAATMSKESADLEAMQSEIRQLDGATNSLANELDTLKIELTLPPRVTLLDDASIPEGTNPITRYVLTALAGISGLFLGSATVVALEYQAHRLNASSELGSTVGLRVLGTVPNLASLSRVKGLNGATALHSILAESVDSVRTILLNQSPDDAPHVIMISSAGDREGKTTVASQLAASLARAGRRTLLIDGDLRSATAHIIFGAALEPGLCEVLRGEVDLAGAIQPTSVDGLMLIAGGQCDYQAIAALSKEQLKEVLQKTREQFEFVVIDAAPVLIYADTLLIGAHVDAAVLSARRDVSRIYKVYEAKERLESVGIRVMGAVVNGISETNRRPAYALPSST